MRKTIDTTKDKIRIRDDEYTSGITKSGEQYLLKFDKESKKEIKIVFRSEDSENVSDIAIRALSQQYIHKVLNNLK